MAGAYGNRTHWRISSMRPLVLKTRALTRGANAPEARFGQFTADASAVPILPGTASYFATAGLAFQPSLRPRPVRPESIRLIPSIAAHIRQPSGRHARRQDHHNFLRFFGRTEAGLQSSSHIHYSKAARADKSGAARTRSQAQTMPASSKRRVRSSGSSGKDGGGMSNISTVNRPRYS